MHESIQDVHPIGHIAFRSDLLCVEDDPIILTTLSQTLDHLIPRVCYVVDREGERDIVLTNKIPQLFAAIQLFEKNKKSDKI